MGLMSTMPLVKAKRNPEGVYLNSATISRVQGPSLTLYSTRLSCALNAGCWWVCPPVRANGYAFNEAMSMENRYFTSDFTNRS